MIPLYTIATRLSIGQHPIPCEGRVDGGKLVGDALEPPTYIVLEISLWYQLVHGDLLRSIS